MMPFLPSRHQYAARQRVSDLRDVFADPVYSGPSFTQHAGNAASGAGVPCFERRHVFPADQRIDALADERFGRQRSAAARESAVL